MNKTNTGIALVGLGFALLLYAIPVAAQQREYYLVSQWVGDYGQRFCKYGNGTVLNVGVNPCPTSIKGWV
jgi:hypothetical protein